MSNSSNIELVARFCTEKLDLDAARLGDEYYYASMPLCVVDSIFSINARYESVRKVVGNVCGYYQLNQYRSDRNGIPTADEQVSTSRFIELLSEKNPQELASEVFKNRRPTSSRSGILKTDAVVRFLAVLQEFGAEYFQDIPALVNNLQFEKGITSIPGQRSGISLKYFFMLAGSDDIIKPDRMVLRFLEAATGQKLGAAESQDVLTAAVGELNKEGYNLTPRLLDHAIWNYQRSAS